MTATPTHARLDAGWLHDGPLARLLAVLDDHGEEARVVGGAVRNAILGVPLGDIDIATTAPPQEVTSRVVAAGCKAVPTGIAHGTITVLVDGRPFEVTTLREDVETYGRHAKVAFGRDWHRDAERRDFTINALSVSRDGMIHDYVGGLSDIAERRVRFIGDPAQRLAEDYLRILRFFRFHAAYGEGHPDPAGLAACIAAREGLDALSRERVRMEMLKLLVAVHAVPTLAGMSEAGLLTRVIGGVPLLASCANVIKLEAALRLAPDPIRRLGALAVFVAEDADRLRDRLRLTNAEHDRLLSMADAWWRLSPTNGEQAGKTLVYRLGDKFIDRVLLAWSRSQAGVADTMWHDLASLPDRWAPPSFPLRAADFIARGVAKGPALGAALRAAEKAWIESGFSPEANVLAAIADAAIRDAHS